MLTTASPLSESSIDPALLTKLHGLELTTVGELLRYVPRRYLRRGHLTESERPEPGEWITVVGRIQKAQMIQMKRRYGQFLKVVVNDGRANYEASFFNARWIQKVLKPGTRVAMAGTVKLFQNQVQLSHPDWMVMPEDDGIDVVGNAALIGEMYADDADGDSGAGKHGSTASADDVANFSRDIIPMYPATKDVQTWEVWRAVRQVLADTAPAADALTERQRTERGLITGDEAIHRVHLPETLDDIEAARARLKFDEALAVQTELARRRFSAVAEYAQSCRHVPGGLEDQLLARLPFQLTDGQKDVLLEIGEDLADEHPMSRLLQGEVGSGKTLVSLLAMLRVVDNGHQCAILAPTEVLAAQHYRTVMTMLGDLARAGELGAADGATRVGLLTGSLGTAAKRQVLLDAVTGDAGIVIGTHALLEEHVEFFDLGMVVVDEQHRFGVEQRDVLRGKGRDDTRPHFLVMTATPIPRTVAMITFGDLDTSVMTELPRGRQPITTSVVPMRKATWVDRVWARANEEIDAGRQAYVVCTKIGDEQTNAKKGKAKKGKKGGPQQDAEDETISVLELAEQLAAGPLAGRRLGILHGRLPADEKNDVMDAFTRGEIDILVATTVIEVGVDVPNATMMVIVNAERFGVSQLHQLRGRVGRGQHAGLCLLMTMAGDMGQSMERLRAVEASTDGFELARVDLAQRREGDILGSLQSGGKSSLSFLSLLDDVEVIADARDLAEQIVLDDPELVAHPALADLVHSILLPSRAEYLDKS
ncbi:ATP-dependent DNA helicase RecG [Gordonia hydrophobica]|uniref:ATP-dependent DNA helicase RecG n=1 Tax=Gordonia hydrophobica TaxID=40516 RepID=A0ABZ2U0T6_9ACTN|nr:ATP-dependent DNA helicase RecG [Gordonia hydrophobica]MBM7366462.1 ATP-dependent DNA helicase RecG [Gordonia hydrophobica]